MTYRTFYPKFWTDAKVRDELCAAERYLFLYLLTNSNVNICGCMEISRSVVLSETGLKEDFIFDSLDKLQRLGFIEYDSQTNEILIANWGRYNWTLSEDLLKAVNDVARHIKSEALRNKVFSALENFKNLCENTPSPQGGGTSIPISVSVSESISVSDNIGRKKKNAKLSKTKLADFNTFWAAYPRKVGKEQAMTAFSKIDVPLSEILAGLERMKRTHQWTKENGQFIPYPSTWLNRGGWNDEEAGEFLPRSPLATPPSREGGCKSGGNDDRKRMMEKMRREKCGKAARRTSSEATEPWGLRRGEGYEACEDEMRNA